VKVGETKTVEITILPGQSSYLGTIQNGIESYDYVEWEGSFKFNDAAQTTDTQTIPTKSDKNLSSEVFNEGVIMT